MNCKIDYDELILLPRALDMIDSTKFKHVILHVLYVSMLNKMGYTMFYQTSNYTSTKLVLRAHIPLL